MHRDGDGVPYLQYATVRRDGVQDTVTSRRSIRPSSTRKGTTMDDIQALGDTATSRQSIEQRPRHRGAPARACSMSVSMGAQHVCRTCCGDPRGAGDPFSESSADSKSADKEESRRRDSRSGETDSEETRSQRRHCVRRAAAFSQPHLTRAHSKRANAACTSTVNIRTREAIQVLVDSPA